MQDEWIKEHCMLTPEKTHAVGVVVLSWGLCDYWLGALFTVVGRIPENASHIIVKNSSSKATWDNLMTIAEVKGLSADIRAALAAGRKDYERCQGLRNVYAHASFVEARPGSDSILSLATRSGRKPGLQPVADDLETIRASAEDISQCGHHLQNLTMAIHTILEGGQATLPQRPPRQG